MSAFREKIAPDNTISSRGNPRMHYWLELFPLPICFYIALLKEGWQQIFQFVINCYNFYCHIEKDC